MQAKQQKTPDISAWHTSDFLYLSSNIQPDSSLKLYHKLFFINSDLFNHLSDQSFILTFNLPLLFIQKVHHFCNLLLISIPLCILPSYSSSVRTLSIFRCSGSSPMRSSILLHTDMILK